MAKMAQTRAAAAARTRTTTATICCLIRAQFNGRYSLYTAFEADEDRFFLSATYRT